MSSTEKKNKELWAGIVGARHGVAYSLGWQVAFVSVCTVEGPCDSRVGFRKRERRGQAGSVFPLALLSCIAFSSGVGFCGFR